MSLRTLSFAISHPENFSQDEVQMAASVRKKAEKVVSGSLLTKYEAIRAHAAVPQSFTDGYDVVYRK